MKQEPLSAGSYNIYMNIRTQKRPAGSGPGPIEPCFLYLSAVHQMPEGTHKTTTYLHCDATPLHLTFYSLSSPNKKHVYHICYFAARSASSERSFWCSSQSHLIFTTQKVLVPCANLAISLLIPISRSFMNKLKSTNPRAELWGTLLFTFLPCENSPLTAWTSTDS